MLTLIRQKAHASNLVKFIKKNKEIKTTNDTVSNDENDERYLFSTRSNTNIYINLSLMAINEISHLALHSFFKLNSFHTFIENQVNSSKVPEQFKSLWIDAKTPNKVYKAKFTLVQKITCSWGKDINNFPGNETKFMIYCKNERDEDSYSVVEVSYQLENESLSADYAEIFAIMCFTTGKNTKEYFLLIAWLTTDNQRNRNIQSLLSYKYAMTKNSHMFEIVPIESIFRPAYMIPYEQLTNNKENFSFENIHKHCDKKRFYCFPFEKAFPGRNEVGITKFSTTDD
jgi:hypothetical protein